MGARQKIGIVRDSNLGGPLGRGLRRAGHLVRDVRPNRAAVSETARWADIVVLALPLAAAANAAGVRRTLRQAKFVKAFDAPLPRVTAGGDDQDLSVFMRDRDPGTQQVVTALATVVDMGLRIASALLDS